MSVMTIVSPSCSRHWLSEERSELGLPKSFSVTAPAC